MYIAGKLNRPDILAIHLNLHDMMEVGIAVEAQNQAAGQLLRCRNR